MAEQFLRLAPALQQFHRLVGRHSLRGRVEIHAPKSPMAKLLALLLGTPLSASEGAITFELDARPLEEIWTRHFPLQSMKSRLQLIDGQLVEKLGVARLIFDLIESNGQLNMRLKRLHFFGIKCPAWLMPCVTAEETGGSGCMHFNVSAVVPGIGLIASYRGYLTLPDGTVTNYSAELSPA